MTSLTDDPLPQAVHWAEHHAGSRVTGVIPLPGGTTAAVHALNFENGERLVIKRFVVQSFVDAEPERARHEATALALLESSEVPVPRLVAFDESGTESGVPSLLSVFVRGGLAIDLAPERLAEVAVSISEVSPGNISWRYRPYLTGHDLFVPAWTRDESGWTSVIKAASTLEYASTSLVHRDFHPGNVLAEGGMVTGVVDWLSACVGPWEIDVAHCRLNLVLQGRSAAADRYLRHYEALTGRSYDPSWDAMACLDGLPYYDGRQAVDGWTGHSVLYGDADRALQQHRLAAWVSRTADELS